MASYVDCSLTSGEQVLYRETISNWSQFLYYVLALVLLPLYGIGLLFLIPPYINKISTELAITNKRVIAKFGFISRKTVEINISKVESIQVHQDILGRLCNYGTIIISGAGNPQAPITNISNPMGFRTAFLSAQERVAKP